MIKKHMIIAIASAAVVATGAVTGGIVYHNHQTKQAAIVAEKEKTQEKKDASEYQQMFKTAQEQLAEAILSDEERAAYTEDLLKFEKDAYSDKEKTSLKKLAKEISQKFDESEEILNDEMKAYSDALPKDITFADEFTAEQFSALGEVKTLMKEQKYQSAYNKFIGIETSVTAYLNDQGKEIVVAEENTNSKAAERKAALKKSAAASNAISSNTTASTTGGNNNTFNTGNTSNAWNAGMTGGNSSTNSSSNGSSSSSGWVSGNSGGMTQEEFDKLRKEQEENLANGITSTGGDPNGTLVTELPTRAEAESYVAATDAAYQQYCANENAEIAAGHRPAGTFLIDEYTWSLSNGYPKYGEYKNALDSGHVR